MPYKNKGDKREYQRKYMAKLRAKQKKKIRSNEKTKSK